MPRRRFRRRPFRRPRRRFGRKRRFGRVRRPISRVPIINIKQRLTDSVTIPAGVDNFIHTNSNSIQQLPNYVELNRVFKYFRINFIKLEYFPTNLLSDPLSPQSTCVSVVDLDGTNTPTVAEGAKGILNNSQSHVTQWSNIGGKRPTKRISYRPRCTNLLSTDNTGVTGVVGLARYRQWYPLEEADDLIFYGSHVGWFTQSNYPVQQDMFLMTTLYVSVKGVK